MIGATKPFETFTPSPYGRLLAELQLEGGKLAFEWLRAAAEQRPDSAVMMTLPPADRAAAVRDALKRATLLYGPAVAAAPAGGVAELLALAGSVASPEVSKALLMPGAGAALPDDFFRREGGGKPSEAERTRFQRLWKQGAFHPPPLTPLVPPPTPLVVSAPDELRLLCPMEITLSPTPPPGTGGVPALANGRLVVTLKDPHWLGELARLRELSLRDRSATDSRSSLLLGEPARPWRVVGLESSLEPIPMPGPQQAQQPQR
jgi:hypothetical protein